MASSLNEYIPLFEIAATFVVDPTLKGKEINPATQIYLHILMSRYLSVAGLIPTATFTRKGLASVDMVNVLPKSTNTNNTNMYMEVFNHPVSFKGAFILISGFQDSTISDSVSLVLCRSHNGLSAPTVIPLHGSSARLTIYGVLSGSKVRYCVHVPSAYMHIQSISLHPLGISLLDVVSDVSSWTRLG